MFVVLSNLNKDSLCLISFICKNETIQGHRKYDNLYMIVFSKKCFITFPDSFPVTFLLCESHLTHNVLVEVGWMGGANRLSTFVFHEIKNNKQSIIRVATLQMRYDVAKDILVFSSKLGILIFSLSPT